MATQKIEPRLQDELERIEVAGASGRLLSVIVQVHDEQAGVLQALERMGAQDTRRLGLANAVAASLTVEQVRTIAGHPHVKLVVSNRQEKVTT